MANYIIVPDTKTYSIHTTNKNRLANFLPGFDVLSFTRMDVQPRYIRRIFHRRILTQSVRI